jgi:hypothetical protein
MKAPKKWCNNGAIEMSDGDLEVDEYVDEQNTNTDKKNESVTVRPSETQLLWLQRGLDQAGGKLPLFDRIGQKVSEKTVRSCIRQGWAEPWLNNPIKPDWLVCRLTDAGRELASGSPMIPDEDI